MKIYIRDIRSAGLKLDQDIAPEEIDLISDDLKFVSPLHLSGKVVRVEDTILAEVEIKSRFSVPCGRCLEPVEADLDIKAEYDYSIDKNTELIDLGDDIRQEIILSTNNNLLCSAACKGICAGCGVNLNKESCVCNKK